MREHYIKPEQAGTLAGLFRERLKRTPNTPAYRHYDLGGKSWADTTWRDMAIEAARWQLALQKEGLKRGDRVAVMLRNCREWVLFDQAALGLGLVTVPLYTNDRPDNVAYIARDANVRLLVVEGKRQWRQLQNASDGLPEVQRIVSVSALEQEDEPEDPRLISLTHWLFGLEGLLQAREGKPDDLATIVYTSGTTGRPKGVMLSHRNILENAYAAACCGDFSTQEVFLSFLPLSHMLERTGGYYMAMTIGALTAYARSVQQLAEDLRTVRPTVLISVPRIYETIHAKIFRGLEKASALQRRLFNLSLHVGWHRFELRYSRASWSPKLWLWPVLERLVARRLLSNLGGRLTFAVCGGAALPPDVGRLFLSLGLPVFQGYGMTEASPTVTVNRPEDNVPASIGLPLPGVEVKIAERGELLTRGPHVMLGYWNNEAATHAAIDEDGWLHTGDQARVDEGGRYYITGRLKEIIALANGEKVPPADMEMAITMDPLIEQVMLLGEGKPYLAALAVLNPEHWKAFAEDLALDPRAEISLRDRLAEKAVLTRIAKQLREFPGYARVRRVRLSLKPWTIEDGLLTPTLKMKRPQIMRRFASDIEMMYEAHAV